MLLSMLRPPCDTAAMSNDDVSTLLAAARGRLFSLRPAVERGAPWPLSDHFDHSPEASWGPPELLAHLAEMAVYWDAELTRVATSGLPEPVPFGRIATDDDRLDNIRRERTRPPGELFDAIAVALDAFGARWSSWSAAERTRVGIHPARGEITVAAGAERFFGSHLDEHAAQLEGILAATQGGG
jgi:hypothetical protein